MKNRSIDRGGVPEQLHRHPWPRIPQPRDPKPYGAALHPPDCCWGGDVADHSQEGAAFDHDVRRRASLERGFPPRVSTAISTGRRETAHSLIHSYTAPRHHFQISAGLPGPAPHLSIEPPRRETTVFVSLAGPAVNRKLTHLWRDFGQIRRYSTALRPVAMFHVKRTPAVMLAVLIAPQELVSGMHTRDRPGHEDRQAFHKVIHSDIHR